MNRKYCVVAALAAFVGVHMATVFDRNSVALAVGYEIPMGEVFRQTYETLSEDDEISAKNTEIANASQQDEEQLKTDQLLGSPEAEIQAWTTINASDESSKHFEEALTIVDEVYVFNYWVEAHAEALPPAQ